jgi:hypothetical protein
MKHIKTILAVLAMSSMLVACDMSDFENINRDPNQPSSAYTGMLFVNAATYTPDFIMNRASNSYDEWMQMITGYIAPSVNDQFHALNSTINFGTSSFYAYAIKDLNTIIEMNEDESTKSEVSVTSFSTSNDNQIAMAITLRSFFYMSMTDILGPIVYTEAFQGESEDNWKPAYDNTEAVYAGLDAELTAAYAQFDESTSVSSTYDILFGGDIAKWKKFNATLRMMMAIKMKDVDPTNGKARFAAAYSDGGMTSNDDNFTYTYDNKTLVSPFYRIGGAENSNPGLGYTANSAIVDSLKAYNDNRIFSYFTIGDDAYLGARDGDPTDMSYYYGIPYGLIGNGTVDAYRQIACSVTQKYCAMEATYNLISVTRTLLVEAEAAVLGWISADAETLYNEAITLSFEDLEADGIDEYLAQSKVQLSSDTDTAIYQIVMQRWLAGFLTDFPETWADWRINNIPLLDVGDNPRSTGITVFPYRMQYEDTDKETNTDQVQLAIDTYLGGVDTRWSRIWWDTEDNE